MDKKIVDTSMPVCYRLHGLIERMFAVCDEHLWTNFCSFTSPWSSPKTQKRMKGREARQMWGTKIKSLVSTQTWCILILCFKFLEFSNHVHNIPCLEWEQCDWFFKSRHVMSFFFLYQMKWNIVFIKPIINYAILM